MGERTLIQCAWDNEDVLWTSYSCMKSTKGRVDSYFLYLVFLYLDKNQGIEAKLTDHKVTQILDFSVLVKYK